MNLMYRPYSVCEIPLATNVGTAEPLLRALEAGVFDD